MTSPSILVLRSVCESSKEAHSSTTNQQQVHAWHQIIETTQIRCDLLLLPELPEQASSHATASFQERRNVVLQQEVTHIEKLQLNPCGMENVILLTDLPLQSHDFLLSVTSCHLDLPLQSQVGGEEISPPVLPVEAVPSTFSFSFTPQNQSDLFFYVPPTNDEGGDQQQHHTQSSPSSAEVSLSFDLSEAHKAFQEHDGGLTQNETWNQENLVHFQPDGDGVSEDQNNDHVVGKEQQQSTSSWFDSIARFFGRSRASDPSHSVGHNGNALSENNKTVARIKSDEDHVLETDKCWIDFITTNETITTESTAEYIETNSRPNPALRMHKPSAAVSERQNIQDLSSQESTLVISQPNTTEKSHSFHEATQQAHGNVVWSEDDISEEAEEYTETIPVQPFNSTSTHSQPRTTHRPADFYKRSHHEELLLKELQIMAKREEEFVTTVLYGMTSVGIVLVVLFLRVLQRLRRKLDAQTAEPSLSQVAIDRKIADTPPVRIVSEENASAASDPTSDDSNTQVDQTGEDDAAKESTRDSAVDNLEANKVVVSPTRNYLLGNSIQDETYSPMRLDTDKTPVAFPASHKPVQESFQGQNISPICLSEENPATKNSETCDTVPEGQASPAMENLNDVQISQQNRSYYPKPFLPAKKKTSFSTDTSVSQSIVRNLLDELLTATAVVDPAPCNPPESSETSKKKLDADQTGPFDSGRSELESQQQHTSDRDVVALSSAKLGADQTGPFDNRGGDAELDSQQQDAPDRPSVLVPSAGGGQCSSFIPPTTGKKVTKPKLADSLSLAGLIAERSGLAVSDNDAASETPGCPFPRELTAGLPQEIHCCPAEASKEQKATSNPQHLAPPHRQSPDKSGEECPTDSSRDQEQESSSFSFSKLAQQWERKTQSKGSPKRSLSVKKGLELSPCSQLAQQWEESKNLRRKKKRAAKQTLLPDSNDSLEQHAGKTLAPTTIPTSKGKATTSELVPIQNSSRLSDMHQSPPLKPADEGIREKKVGKPLYISPFISPITDDDELPSGDSDRHAPSPASTAVSSDDSFLQDYW